MTDGPDSFVRSAWLISALTFLSRLLGIVRDVACAAFFGAGMVWDAFSFAFRIPNLFRRLFGEGALSAAFIPTFAQYLEGRPKEDARRLAGRVTGALGLVLLALLLVGEALVLSLWSWLDLSPRWRLALMLTAVMLPYMLFICMTALAGAMLNAMKHFAAPALAPVVLNICWIAAIVVVAPLVAADMRGRIFVVAGGILTAGVLQLALQLAALSRKGFRWRVRLEPLHPEVGRLVASMAPVALGLAALQLNVLLDGVIAISLAAPPGEPTFSLFGATIRYPMEIGANSVLYYGNRLMQFPLGVFGIALATAAFPTLSRQAARQDWQGFSRSVLQALGVVLFIGIPASVGLILLRYPAIELLFERGAFTPSMTARTATVVFAYSTAIWAYCGLHVLTRAFYSLKEYATPAKVAAGAVALNLTLNLILVWPLREAGLAAATATCATLQVVLLCCMLRRRVRLPGLGTLGATLWKTGAATVCMAGACWGTLQLLPAAQEPVTIGLKLLRVALPVMAGAVVYLGIAAVLRIRELRVAGAALRGLLRQLSPSGRGPRLKPRDEEHDQR